MNALIQYNGNNVLNCGLIKGGFLRILPGINSCDAKELEEVLKLRSVKARVDSGLLKIIDDGKSNAGKKSVEELVSMMPKIFDKKLLAKIIRTDGRAPVTDAAKAQLALIEVKAEEKDKEDVSTMHFN